jgi:hypothetical protein
LPVLFARPNTLYNSMIVDTKKQGDRNYLRTLLVVEVTDDTASKDQGVLIVNGQVISDSGDLTVHISASQILSRDNLSSGSLDQRGASQENGSLLLDNDTLVSHGGDIGTTGCAGSQDNSDLGNAHGRHVGLVVKDASKVLLVREDVQLAGQVGSTRLDQVDTGQAVLPGDLLSTQVLLDSDRVVGASLDGRVVGNNHALDAVDATNTGNDSSCRDLVLVKLMSSKLTNLEERRSIVQQAINTISHCGMMWGGVSVSCGFESLFGIVDIIGKQESKCV